MNHLNRKMTVTSALKILELCDKKLCSDDRVDSLLESGFLDDLLTFFGGGMDQRCPDLESLRRKVAIEMDVISFPENGASMFASPTKQLEIFKGLNDRDQLGFSAQQLETAMESIPSSDENDGLVVWTLEAMLANGKDTFNYIRSQIKSRGNTKPIRTSARCIGVRPFCSWSSMSLRWVKIDLGALQGVAPEESFSEPVAHCAPMWQAVYSPNWFYSIGRTINDTLIPEVSLCGFALDYRGEGNGVPHLEPSRIRMHSIDHSFTNNGKGEAAIALYVEGHNTYT